MKTVVLLFAVLAFLCGTASASQAADVGGKWHFVLDTPDGERAVDGEFKVDGGTLTGKWGGIDIKGTYSDGKLAFSFPFTPEQTGEEGTLTIKLEVQGDTLSGTWEFAEYSGSYKATRTKES